VMIIEIFKLFGSVLIDDKEANKSIQKIDKKVGKFTKKLGKGIKTAAKWGAGLAAGAAVAGGAMLALTDKVTGTLDSIAKTSQKLGITTDAMQEMEYWASQNGISSQSLERAVGRLNQRMGRAAAGNEKYADALTNLGINMDDVKDGTLSTEDAMVKSIQTLSQMSSEQEKSAAASELFGTKMARDLMPALQDGSLSLEDAAKKAHELGIVLDEDAISASTKFQDSFDNFKRVMTSVGQKMAVGLIPTFQSMFEWIESNMPTIQRIAGTAFGFIGDTLQKVGGFIQDKVIPAFQSLWEWFEPNIPAIKEIFEQGFGIMKEVLNGVVEAVKSTTTWFQDHWAIVEPILAGIAAGIVTFKLITGAIAAYRAAMAIATAVQLAYNAALVANPIGIVVVAIGLLVAAGVALWKNWDVVKKKLGQLWSSVKSIFGKIGDFAQGVWDGMVSGIRGSINGIIRALNGMINGLNRINIDAPDWVKNLTGIGSFGINIPNIPMLAKGGHIKDDGSFIAGEEGPELISGMKGATVTPLNEKGAVYRFDISIPLDGREFVKRTIEFTAQQLEERRSDAARG
jgi:phage-related minor tail protein